jgi:hypothetical protein
VAGRRSTAPGGRTSLSISASSSADIDPPCHADPIRPVESFA